MGTSRRLLTLGTLVTIALACACAPSPKRPEAAPQRPSAQPPAPIATPVAAADAGAKDAAARSPSPLGARRLARVRAAYGALDAALGDWGLEAFGQNCLVLFGESEEWILGCPGMPTDARFASTGETWNGAPVLWEAPPLRFDKTSVPYDALKVAIVGTVGSYHRDGEDAPVLVVQDWDTLHKNHPGFLQSPVEEWLGVFVHEAFHARQLWHPRVRRVMKTMTGLNGLEDLYKSDPAYAAAVASEHALLSKALDDPELDSARARRALAQWLALYDRRGAQFASQLARAVPGGHAWDGDAIETFVEGTARYVEARFLIAGVADADAQLASDPTFHAFAASRGKRPTQLDGLGLGRRYYYAIGMELSFLLDVADPGWKAHVLDSDGLLVDQVRRSAGTTARAAR